MQRKDGQMYAPVGISRLVCKPGEFTVGVIGLDHGHIYGMCNGLVEAGATVTHVWDPDRNKIAAFIKAFPAVKVETSGAAIYDNPKIDLVATAAIPSDRSSIATKALMAGKHVFSDKPAMTNFGQLEAVRSAVELSGKRFGIYFSERLHVEAAGYADNLIAEGSIGKVVQTIILGPHRLSKPTRPDWFFRKEKFGGILTDIGSHQIDQILHFGNARHARVLGSKVANYNNPDFPEFEDFGDATLLCDNGSTGYFRVDWFTPDGLKAWGDGRTIILGTGGFIELRKYVDLARSDMPNTVYMANGKGEFSFDANNTVGFPFFGRFIRDCLDHTELAISQDYTLHVMELALTAQKLAARISEEAQ